MPNFLAFLSYSIITTFTPGPNNLMAMANAGRYGFKKSLPFNAGVFSGFFIVLSFCSFFSSTLFTIIPSIKSTMTYIGAAYILWLAWNTYKSVPHNDTKENKHTNKYISGLLLQFVNPKGIIYAITTVSTFIVPYYKSGVIYIILAVFLSSMAFVSNCCWGLFGTVFQKMLVNNYKVINAVMALLLVYCSVSLFM